MILSYFKNADSQKSLNGALNAIKSHRKIKRRNLVIRYVSYSAAAAILFITFSLLNKPIIEDISIDTPQLIEYKMDDILTPTLFTHSGGYSLSDTLTVKSKTDYKIVDGTIVREISQDTTVRYNEIVIPRGYRYKVELSDGTIVHLNAGSLIKYPTKFTGNSRRVKLEGEAYFSVKKSDKPFIVEAGSKEIKVYGTEFNVNNSQSGVVTTLLVEGSVSVKVDESKELFIKPNEIVKYNSNNKSISVDHIENLENYLGWINGDFRYRNHPLRDVIADISSWYGVDVTLQPNMLETEVSLFARREQSISEILSLIEFAINVKFTKKGGNEYIVEMGEK